MLWWGGWRTRSACELARRSRGPTGYVRRYPGGPPSPLQAADDLGEGGAGVFGGDQVGQAEPLAAGVQVLADLGGAADEDGRHLPDRLRVDAGPAALADQFLGVGTPLVRQDEGAERVEFQRSEPVAGCLAEHGDLGVERRGQPVRRVVAA